MTAIYSPALQRNLQTAQPLADLLGLEINGITEAGDVHFIKATYGGVSSLD